MFVDRIEIEVGGGRGGNGCCSFRRERYVPRGGPDGGDGGNGGSIVIVAQEGVDNLSAIARQKRWSADRGLHGQGSNRHGRCAKDVYLNVPLGTLVLDSKEGYVIKDLAELGDQVTVARGGRGGRGNVHFKSATNRAPRQWLPGEEGERRTIILELKIIADVGLIGKPNAGKSTLLSRLSRARPEVASYPFTTKHPNLGQVRVDQDRCFLMADIPGLIEGAHKGVGLGHEFLRHVERTRVLVHMVEPLPMDGSDPIENYHAIRQEITQYDANMSQKPEIVVVSKSELPEAEPLRSDLQDQLGHDVISISGVTGAGLNVLCRSILQRMELQDAS